MKFRATVVFALCFLLLFAFAEGVELDNNDNNDIGGGSTTINNEVDTGITTGEDKTEGVAAQSNTAATTSTGEKIDKKRAVKFGKIRSLWRKIQKWRDETDGDIVLDSPYYPVGENNDAPDEVTSLASVDVKKRVFGYQSRFMFSSGHILSTCKTSKLTDKCKNLALSPSSAIVEVDDHGGERFVFTVTGRSVSPRGNASQNPKEKKIERWTVDAKTIDKREVWMALIRNIINAPVGSSNVQENIQRSRIASTEEGDHDYHDQQHLWWGDGLYYGPAFRGDELGPDEYPLHPGQYLSNVSPPPQQQLQEEDQQQQDAPVTNAVNLYVSFVGALMLRSGPVPPDVFAATWLDDDEDTEMPIWMHKAQCSNDLEKLMRAQDTMTSTGAETSRVDPSGDDVEGESRIGKATDEWPAPQTLAVRNGRMRLGGNPNCEIALTPAPRGSWRRFLPWSARWRAIRDSTLRITSEGGLAIVSPSGEMLLSVNLNDSSGEYMKVSQG